MELSIDPEFKKWIMPLRDDEFRGLEENILMYGCTQPLDTWKGILIDGHNRYKICKEHGIYFEIHEMEFDSRDDAKNYMIKNQLARRNVTPEQRDYLMGKLYSEQKQNSSENLNRNQSPMPQSEAPRKSEQIGEQFNVNHATVERAEKYANAVDVIAENCGHDIRDKILSRSIDVTKKDVIRLASMSHQEQQAAISKMRSGMKGKHAIDRIFGDSEPEQKHVIDIEKDTIEIPCCNPRCEKTMRITPVQFREFFGVYPEKYGHISIPYCSRTCRDIMFSRLANGIKC
jgi:hypothetical protein